MNFTVKANKKTQQHKIGRPFYSENKQKKIGRALGI
jgi:hypothetical protein